MITKDGRKWGPDEWEYPPTGTPCHICGHPVGDEPYIDLCDTCGERACGYCLASRSPTVCKACDVEMCDMTQYDRAHAANVAVGRVGRRK